MKWNKMNYKSLRFTAHLQVVASWVVHLKSGCPIVYIEVHRDCLLFYAFFFYVNNVCCIQNCELTIEKEMTGDIRY